MRLLFFDLEYATQRKDLSAVCEFGYVVTDEKFSVIERDNIIINPDISYNSWDWYVLKNILTRPIKEYTKKNKLTYYYGRISGLFQNADYVLGHSLDSDTVSFNRNLQRYRLDPIDYDFYDVKLIYQEYAKQENGTSVTNIMNELEIYGEENTHDAETDAYNTMLILKKIAELKGASFESVIAEYPSSRNRTEGFMLDSLRASIAAREKELLATLTGDGTNDIIGYGINRRRLNQFIDNCRPSGTGTGKLKNRTVLLSTNYEEHHFRQVLNLVQLITDEGGRITNNSSHADMYVKYDAVNEEGKKKKCKRLFGVRKMIAEGSRISIVSFAKFLSILGITEEELDSMPMISFDFLFEKNAVIRDNKDKQAVEWINCKKYQ